jgi:hypothetical protein
VTPIVASRSLALRSIAPGASIQTPACPAPEPRHPSAEGRSRRQLALGAAGTARRTGRGGSTVTTDPLRGSRPPSTRRQQSHGSKVAPGLHCRRPITSSSCRGGLRSRGYFCHSSDHHHHRLSLHSSTRRRPGRHPSSSSNRPLHRHRSSGSSRPHRHHRHSRPRHRHWRRRRWSCPPVARGANLREEAIPILPDRMGGVELHVSD